MALRLEMAKAMGQFALVMAKLPAGDFVYRVPASDDPKTWTHLFGYCYADVAYRYYYRLLKRKSAGVYCPLCGEEKPGGDWYPAQCLPHYWDEHGYELATKSARLISGRIKNGWETG